VCASREDPGVGSAGVVSFGRCDASEAASPRRGLYMAGRQYMARRMWEGRPDARRWPRMSNRIQRRAAVRSFCWRTHGLYTSRAATHVVPSSLARAAGGPCPPRLSVPPGLAQNHHRTPRRRTTDAVPSTIYIIDPAFWPLPRFFGGKVASTALQPFSGCEGG